MRRLAGGESEESYAEAYEALIHEASRHPTRSPENRTFSRDKQEYRKKSRGLVKKKRGRPRTKQYKTIPIPPETEINYWGDLVLNG
jgi:hypothetical protein